MSMPLQRLLPLVLLLLLLIGGSLPVAAQSTSSTQAFLPLIMGNPVAPSPFGFDVRTYTSPAALPYMAQANPRWARAGDVFWSDVEPVRGGGYHWDMLAAVDANVQRLNTAGVAPTLVIQRTPSWAQKIPGRLCSPVAPAYIQEYVAFVQAVAQHYSSGLLKVNYLEIANEPDVAPQETSDSQGFGCWADRSVPDQGGAYYGWVLQQIYPAIKQIAPETQVIAGALAYFWPNDTNSHAFLEGMLGAGAGNAFDILSFHAYGEWDSGDLMISKANRLRQILNDHGLIGKPLFATEIAATCGATSCPTDFETRQANYAARIYAEAIALGLDGAFWYTLAIDPKISYRSSQLIDQSGATLTPHKAFWAFTNSALWLQGAHYVGPPLQSPTPDQANQVQVLVFQKPNILPEIARVPTVTLYVLWVPEPNGTPPLVYYNLPVPPGAIARCVQHLDQQTLQPYYCSDTTNSGSIPLAIGQLPQYVEVYSQ